MQLIAFAARYLPKRPGEKVVRHTLGAYCVVRLALKPRRAASFARCSNHVTTALTTHCRSALSSLLQDTNKWRQGFSLPDLAGHFAM